MSKEEDGATGKTTTGTSSWRITLLSPLDKLQRLLALEFLQQRIDNDAPDDEPQFQYPQFATQNSVGRAGLVGCVLGIIWGVHVMGMVLFCGMQWWRAASAQSDNIAEASDNVPNPMFFSTVGLRMLVAWCFYVTCLAAFHLLEFFVTCLYNPTQASCESFLINHSKAYTGAILLATTEFWIRFWLFPSLSFGWTIAGVLVVMSAQSIRTLAMATCGESFHHFIQTSKRDNHVLVTKGIYRYFRHPSYVGFFYYSIGTQLVLGNMLSLLAFAAAGWLFFSKRIPYEERSLIHHFGDAYYEYAQTTYVGIPFISSRGLVPVEDESDGDVSDNNNEGIEQVWTQVEASSDAVHDPAHKKTQ